MKTLYMETTEVPPERTAREIVSLLVAAGATQVNMSYASSKIIGLRWCFLINGREQLFDMPVRVDPIFKILKSRIKNTWLSDQDQNRMRTKSERVAWRQLLRWIQSQVALIQTGMVQPCEPFVAYMFDPALSQTLFQTLMEGQFKALPAPTLVPEAKQ